MTSTALPPLLALALLALLAGCGASAPDATTTPADDETFEVELTGNASATYFVAVDLVADPLDSTTVTHANGTTRTVEAPRTNGALSFGIGSNVTAVEPDGEIVGGGYFEGSPRFSVTARELPPTPNAVYTVRRSGQESLVAWGFVRCERHVSSLSLAADDAGEEGFESVGVAFGCE